MKVIITARVKNAHLVEARLALGYKTMKDMERGTGLRSTMICAAENFKYCPALRDTIDQWEKAYKMPIEYLFPEGYKIAVKHKMGRPVSIVRDFKVLPMVNNPIHYLESWDEDKSRPEDFLPEALTTLTEREAKVLKLRYGIDGEKELTLRQIGDKFKVTQERIRQIEAKALRKLKHPARSRKIRSRM